MMKICFSAKINESLQVVDHRWLTAVSLPLWYSHFAAVGTDKAGTPYVWIKLAVTQRYHGILKKKNQDIETISQKQIKLES